MILWELKRGKKPMTKKSSPAAREKVKSGNWVLLAGYNRLKSQFENSLLYYFYLFVVVVVFEKFEVISFGLYDSDGRKRWVFSCVCKT